MWSALARAAGVSGVMSQPRRYGAIDVRVWLADGYQPLQHPLLAAKSVYPALRGVILFKPEAYSVLPAAVANTTDDLAAGVDELLGGWIPMPRMPAPLRPPADPLRAGIKALREVSGVKRVVALEEDELLAVVLDLDGQTTLTQLQSAALAAGVMLGPAALESGVREPGAAVPFWLAAHPELRESPNPPPP